MACILLVEDDPHMLRILSMWLTRSGHEIVEARDGLKGQEHLRNRRFDVMVSDVNMPGLDGLSLVRWLRGEQGSGTSVILLSSRSDQAEIAEEMEPLGVRIYPKPFSPSRLVAEIERRISDRSNAAGDSGEDRAGPGEPAAEAPQGPEGGGAEVRKNQIGLGA